jgi:hypothetical protein
MTHKLQIADLAKGADSHQPKIHAYYMAAALKQLMDASEDEPTMEEFLHLAEKLTRQHPKGVPLPSVEESLAGNPHFDRVENLSTEEKRDLEPLPLRRKSSLEKELPKPSVAMGMNYVYPVGDTPGGPMLLPGDTMVWVEKRSHTQRLMKEKIQQLEKLKKKKEPLPLRRKGSFERFLGKEMQKLPKSKPVAHKPFCSPDFVKEALRAKRKALMALARLKDAKIEAERETVSASPTTDIYAAVRAKKIREEQEERKFQVQNPHNGLATRVRVTSTKKPNKKRRRR